MKLFITSAYPYHPVDNFAVKWLKESAAIDPFGIHTISDDPESADVVLFAEHHPPGDPYFFEVLKNATYKKYKEKVVLYSDSDKPLSKLPGIFPSVEKTFYKKNFNRSGPYIARHCENDSLRLNHSDIKKEFLFSFIGAARTHRVRKNIIKLDYPGSYLKDTSDKNLWELNREEKKRFEKEYVDVSLKSHFILCPRGEGVNSYRLYEAMEMGLAPVIISDDWVPMQGPCWENFSIRISEKDIKEIPAVLQEKIKYSRKMGEEARKNWEHWFSKEVCFHHIASMCEELVTDNKKEIKQRLIHSYRQFLRPFHSRNLLRFYKNRLL